MSYEILPKCNRRNFRVCIHNAKAGVGSNVNRAKIFEAIYQKRAMDFYVCPNAVYLIIGDNYDIRIEDLQCLERDSTGWYIRTFDNNRIYIRPNNFLVLCPGLLNCPQEAWVKEYMPENVKDGS